MLYNPINNQIGMQNNSRATANILPATKLLQAKYPRTMRTEPRQNISIVFILKIYNETIKTEMGIIP
jgi:hypothetical protein